MINKFGSVCCKCGATDNLEFHIVGNGSGSAPGGWQHLELIIDILITKSTPIELDCQKCHLEQHKKQYDGDL
jgi:hypothetical protein